jgi:hypothetical protein
MIKLGDLTRASAKGVSLCPSRKQEIQLVDQSLEPKPDVVSEQPELQVASLKCGVRGWQALIWDFGASF